MPPPVITLTQAAADYIQSVIAKEPEKHYQGLRVSVVKGGCSGSEYLFTYESDSKPGDEIIKDHDATVFIDPSTIFKVIGSVLDYEEDTFSEGLIFKNPNEIGACGCGKSVKL